MAMTGLTVSNISLSKWFTANSSKSRLIVVGQTTAYDNVCARYLVGQR
jgi:hypothetical protein